MSAASAFVRWLAGPVTQDLFGKTKLAYPALKEAANDPRGYAAREANLIVEWKSKPTFPD